MLYMNNKRVYTNDNFQILTKEEFKKIVAEELNLGNIKFPKDISVEFLMKLYEINPTLAFQYEDEDYFVFSI